MTMYDTIIKQLETVTKFKERFDNSLETSNENEARNNLVAWLKESAILDNMEDSYLRKYV
jgi:hypothetical protein